MTAAGAPKRKPAKGLPRRTVTVNVTEGAYEGWACTAYADFKARSLEDFQSGDATRILRFMDSNVIEHNFPDADNPDELAATMGDVENEALSVMTGLIFDAIGKLPNR